MYDDPPITIGESGAVRGYGEELITRVPGVHRSEDIQHVINHPSAIYHDGPYKIVIGDNPNSKGRIEIRLLGGVAVHAVSHVPLDSPAHERDIIFDRGYYERHSEHQDDHLTEEQIRETVENPDEVYEGQSRYGTTVYIWVRYINGKAHFVRAEDFKERDEVDFNEIRYRSSYDNEFPDDKLEGLKERYGLSKIWPQ